jgi:glycosyltransferase involved in cell wall biosynthesis
MDDEKQRILIVAPSYHAEPRTYVERIVREVTDRVLLPNLEFHLVTGRQEKYTPDVEWVGNVLVHRVGSAQAEGAHESLLHTARAWYTARALHRTHAYRGVWAPSLCSCAVVAAQLAVRTKGLQYLLTLHEDDAWPSAESSLRRFGPFSRAVLTAPTRIHAMSEALATWAHKRGARAPVSVIRAGIDLVALQRTPTEVERIRIQDALGWSEGDVWLLSTLPLVPESGLDDVVSAVAVLPSHVKLALVGTGTQVTMLEEHVRKLGLVSRVRFLGAPNPEDVPRYLQVCSLYVAPVRGGRAAYRVAQAMAATLPVVGTRAGDLGELLTYADYEQGIPATGWIVEPDRPRDLARTILGVLEGGTEVVPILERARTVVGERYNTDRNARELFITCFAPMLDL